MKRAIRGLVAGIWLVVAVGACSEPQLRISGRLLGADGKPITVAHVALFTGSPSAAPSALAPVGADGTYSLTSTATGLLTLRFTGVGHAPETVPLLITRAVGVAQVDVTLARLAYADDLSRVALVGDFNDFQRESGTLPLSESTDGRLSVSLGSLAGDRIAYQLINATAPVESINSTYPGIAIPGTAADEYLLRKDGTYASVLAVEGREIRISFDPAPLAGPKGIPSVTVGDAAPETQRFAELAAAMRRELEGYTRLRLALKHRGASAAEVGAFVANYDWGRFETPVRQVLAGDASPIFKQAALVLYLEIVGEAAEMSHSPLAPDLATKSLLEVPPSSQVWTAIPGAFQALTWANYHSPIPGYEAYLDRIVSLHPDTELRTSVLDYALSVAYYAGDTVMAQSLYERLQSDFPDSRAAATAAKLLAPDRRIRVGEPVPEFRITSLDDPTIELSRSSLLGSYYLIDFWATWCGPCLAEMPSLHEAWAQHRDQGFTIVSLSCDESAEKVRQFRRDRSPMPWLHGFLEHCYSERNENEIVTTFEVVGFPTGILVGPDGTILAVGSALRGERLAETLARLVGSPVQEGSE